MKNIAVLVPDFMIEHCRDFIQGILEYFKNKDVAVYIACTQRHFSSPGMFDYQYWNSFELVKSKQIDAYIIASGVYCSTMTYEDVYNLIKELDAPIISDSVDFNLPNSYCVVNDSQKVYCEIIKHLKEEHNCKKIAFMSANKTGSEEALDRFEAFKKALKKNNLEFYEDLVFQGDFTDTLAKKLILDRYKSSADIDFDALVSANDLMASSCIRAFEEIGVKVPDDVKVIGFDNAIFANLSFPRLSTVNQNIAEKGKICAQSAEKILNGQKLQKKIKTNLYPMFRQSCGCISLSNYEMEYKDTTGKIVNDNNLKSDLLQLYQNEVQEKYKYSSLLDVVNVTNTLRQFYFTMGLVNNVMLISSMAVCLFNEPLFVTKRSGFTLPDEVELYMYHNVWTKKEAFRPGIFFDPHKEICPRHLIEDFNLPTIIYPIFAGEKYYGYLACSVYFTDFYAYSVNLKILISFIANSIEYTNSLMQTQKLTNENSKLLENNSTLYIKTKTDELTGILNRRGFMEIGQRTIDLVQETAAAAIVVFGDLDGLKKINDGFGHEMGDRAIKLEAQALRNAFRKDDIIGRLSGDEFAMIGIGLNKNDIPMIKERIIEENRKITEQEKLPFNLSISVGAVDLEASSMLATLLTEADKLLYEAKRIKHAAAK